MCGKINGEGVIIWLDCSGLGFIGELEVAKEHVHVFLNALPCQAIADVVGFLRVFRRVWCSKIFLNLWSSCEKLSFGKIRF